MATTLNAGTATGGAAISADTTGILQLQSGSTPTTAVTIDTAQNVGIGTASPAALGNSLTELTVKATNTDKYANLNLIGIRDVGGNQNGLVNFWNNFGTLTRTSYIGGVNTASSNTSGELIFATAASGTLAERMRIDSSGYLLINETTATGTPATGVVIAPGSNAGGSAIYIGHKSGTGSTNSYATFAYNGGAIGSITQSGTTAVLYNTTSDYRLKTDVTPIQNALATVEALNPVSFTWIDGRPDDGFIAHEIQAVLPNCVTGEKDAINEDGTPKYQQMDSSGVIPFLVKAIQEQPAMIEELKTKLLALETK
jgi:hypothetical protein